MDIRDDTNEYPRVIHILA